MLTHPADARTILYHIVKRSLVILALALAVKYAGCDTSAVKSDRMAPTVQNGDRILFSRPSSAYPFKLVMRYKRNDPVVFVQPGHRGSLGCLRIAGLPGDSVRVEDAMLLASGTGEGAYSLAGNIPADEILPADYSPRDNMPPFRVPAPGDTIAVQSLDMRDFVYLYAMAKQENPNGSITLEPILTVGDSVRNDYLIRDFYAYTGRFGNIPDTARSNWFFWDRLQQYIAQIEDSTPVDISFILRNKGMPVDRYVIRDRFYFLMGDHWIDSYDSRYFGPVSADLMRGRLRAILWSFDPARQGFDAIRWRRIARLEG